MWLNEILLAIKTVVAVDIEESDDNQSDNSDSGMADLKNVNPKRFLLRSSNFPGKVLAMDKDSDEVYMVAEKEAKVLNYDIYFIYTGPSLIRPGEDTSARMCVPKWSTDGKVHVCHFEISGNEWNIIELGGNSVHVVNNEWQKCLNYTPIGSGEKRDTLGLESCPHKDDTKGEKNLGLYFQREIIDMKRKPLPIVPNNLPTIEGTGASQSILTPGLRSRNTTDQPVEFKNLSNKDFKNEKGL